MYRSCTAIVAAVGLFCRPWCRRSYPGCSTKLALVQIFGPRRVLSSCVVNSAGKLTMATPQERRLLLLDARALFFRLLGESRLGTTKRRPCGRNAPPNFFADVTFVRPRGRCRGGHNEGDSAETAASVKYFAATGLRSGWMESSTGHITEAGPQGGTRFDCLAHVCPRSSRRSIPPSE